MQEAEWARIVQAEKTGSLDLSNETRDTERVEWGKGGPGIVKPATTDEYERVHSWFDIHVPFHEPALLDAALTALKDQKPHRLILGGDLADYSLISRFSLSERKAMKEWEVFEKVKGESDEAKRVLDRIRMVHSGPIEFVEGNHCQRLREWLGSEQQASEWMGLAEHGVTYHSRAGFWLRQDYLVKHGDYVPKHTALKEFQENHCGGQSGHKHTDQKHVEVFPATGKKFVWNSAPCMCRLDYDYGPGGSGLARWPQGILDGSFSTTDPYDYDVRVGSWWKGNLHLNGERYT